MDLLAEEKEETKEKLSDAAKLYNDVSNADYLMKIGDRKGVGKEWKIVFNKENFKHTLGLHKCESFEELGSRRCLEKLIKRQVTEKEIDEVDKFPQTKDRIENFSKIKEMLSGDGYAIKSKNGWFNCYDGTKGIKADYMLTSKIEGKGFAHLFLKETSDGVLEPITFIVHNNKKYMENCTDRRKILWVKELPQSKDKDMLLKDKRGEGEILEENSGMKG